MHRFKQICSSALVLFATAGGLLPSAPTLAQSPSPFRATVAITELIQPGGTCGLIGTIAGSGEVTHLGRVTVTSTDCITPIDPSTYAFTSNELVLTAANGDQIRARYSGIFSIAGAIATMSGGFQIFGGTGRFAEATGAGALQGIENISTIPATGQVQLTGTISY